MRTSLKFLALWALVSVLGLGTSCAGDKIHAVLFLAQNEPPPANAKLAGPRLHDQLAAVFGFQHYRLLKEQDFSLRDEWKQWFVPRRDYFMGLEPLPRDPGQPRMLDYEIYKDGFIVVKGTYEPHEEAPLFINGPDYRKGRQILVLLSR
jgi:hypothetical protein